MHRYLDTLIENSVALVRGSRLAAGDAGISFDPLSFKGCSVLSSPGSLQLKRPMPRSPATTTHCIDTVS